LFDDEPAIEIVGCGHVLTGSEMRIVDSADRELAERRVGRIEFRGTSAACGYYRNPAQTARLMRGGWLDTGDLGYLCDGELFIIGRVKDMIIRGGRHFFPSELEDTIGRLPGMRPGGVAVCGRPEPSSGTERLVILVEADDVDAGARSRLLTEINAATVALLGAPAEDIRFVAPHSILKTASGKIRHAATLDLLLSNDGRLPARATWRQILDITVASGNHSRSGARDGLRRLRMARIAGASSP
jgi:acyl-CoA synthetase (AMP-forming)/AMP-acid ligase II